MNRNDIMIMLFEWLQELKEGKIPYDLDHYKTESEKQAYKHGMENTINNIINCI